MSTPLRQLLEEFRASSKTEREKGTYFERLAVAFIKADAGMQQQFEDAWLFSDWAKLHNLSASDIGIDAVAKIQGEDSFCAIQCKFFAEGYRIQKSDIDSFLSSSQQKHFSRGIIIDTTGAPWSPNAEALLDDLNITVMGLDRLEASPIDWAAWFQREEVKVAEPKRLRPHQTDALEPVRFRRFSSISNRIVWRASCFDSLNQERHLTSSSESWIICEVDTEAPDRRHTRKSSLTILTRAS